MAGIDLDNNNPQLARKIAEHRARQPKGRYVMVNGHTSIFVPDGKDARSMVEEFKRKHGYDR